MSLDTTPQSGSHLGGTAARETPVARVAVDIDKHIAKLQTKFEVDDKGRFTGGSMAAFARAAYLENDRERKKERAAKHAEALEKAKTAQAAHAAAGNTVSKLEDVTHVASAAPADPVKPGDTAFVKFGLPAPPEGGDYLLGCRGGGLVWVPAGKVDLELCDATTVRVVGEVVTTP